MNNTYNDVKKLITHNLLDLFAKYKQDFYANEMTFKEFMENTSIKSLAVEAKRILNEARDYGFLQSSRVNTTVDSKYFLDADNPDLDKLFIECANQCVFDFEVNSIV